MNKEGVFIVFRSGLKRMYGEGEQRGCIEKRVQRTYLIILLGCTQGAIKTDSHSLRNRICSVLLCKGKHADTSPFIKRSISKLQQCSLLLVSIPCSNFNRWMDENG